MGNKGRLLGMDFPGGRLRRKIREGKLQEEAQSRPGSWKKGRDGANVARGSHRRSLAALGQKRKLGQTTE